MSAKTATRKKPAPPDREYENAKLQFRQGRDYERALVVAHLRGVDGIGSAREAADIVERKDHWR